MICRTPRSTRTDSPCPYSPLFRSAEICVDDEVWHRAHHRFGLEAVDIGADIVVDGGARDDARELEVVVLVVEARQVELERAVPEGVLRTDLETVDLLGIEGDRHRHYRRQSRVDGARFVGSRNGQCEQYFGGEDGV